MLLAYDYPLLGLFWTILWIYLVIAWLMILFNVVADIFRSKMGGFAKAAWLLVVLVLPLLGVLAYTLANGDAMVDRQVKRMNDQDEAFRSYVQSAAGGGTSPSDQLSQLATLHSQGSITDAEFAVGKAKILG